MMEARPDSTSGNAAASGDATQSATRLLSMIHELHKAGFERIRFISGMSPSGMHWRCNITHAGNLGGDGLSILRWNFGTEVAPYSTGSRDSFFNWNDAPGSSTGELAARFLERFPIIAEQGKGRDPAYATWLASVLARVEKREPGAFPVFFADYPLDVGSASLPPPPQEGIGNRPFWPLDPVGLSQPPTPVEDGFGQSWWQDILWAWRFRRLRREIVLLRTPTTRHEAWIEGHPILRRFGNVTAAVSDFQGRRWVVRESDFYGWPDVDRFVLFVMEGDDIWALGGFHDWPKTWVRAESGTTE